MKHNMKEARKEICDHLAYARTHFADVRVRYAVCKTTEPDGTCASIRHRSKWAVEEVRNAAQYASARYAETNARHFGVRAKDSREMLSECFGACDQLMPERKIREAAWAIALTLPQNRERNLVEGTQLVSAMKKYEKCEKKSRWARFLQRCKQNCAGKEKESGKKGCSEKKGAIGTKGDNENKSSGKKSGSKTKDCRKEKNSGDSIHSVSSVSDDEYHEEPLPHLPYRGRSMRRQTSHRPTQYGRQLLLNPKRCPFQRLAVLSMS